MPDRSTMTRFKQDFAADIGKRDFSESMLRLLLSTMTLCSIASAFWRTVHPKDSGDSDSIHTISWFVTKQVT